MKYPSIETRLLDIIRSPSEPPDNLAGQKTFSLFLVVILFIIARILCKEPPPNVVQRGRLKNCKVHGQLAVVCF